MPTGVAGCPLEWLVLANTLGMKAGAADSLAEERNEAR